MVSDEIRKLLSMGRRTKAAVAACRAFQSKLSVPVSAVPVDESRDSDQPLWFTRASLQERIFQRIAELKIPLDKDRSNEPKSKN